MDTAHLSRGLRNGNRLTVYLEDDSDPISIERRRIASLRLPSGRILACDPSHVFNSGAVLAGIEFARRLPAGDYPFDVCIACYEPTAEDSEQDQRIALAVLSISDAVPEHWELASDFNDPSNSEFSVDVARACFIDAEAAASVWTLRATDKPAFSKIVAEIERQEKATYRHTRSWASIVVDRDSGANLVTCSTGWGDGVFRSYWGLNDRGEALCFVVDFNILAGCTDRS